MVGSGGIRGYDVYSVAGKGRAMNLRKELIKAACIHAGCATCPLGLLEILTLFERMAVEMIGKSPAPCIGTTKQHNCVANNAKYELITEQQRRLKEILK
jgi:hypothetical protein